MQNYGTNRALEFLLQKLDLFRSPETFAFLQLVHLFVKLVHLFIKLVHLVLNVSGFSDFVPPDWNAVNAFGREFEIFFSQGTGSRRGTLERLNDFWIAVLDSSLALDQEIQRSSLIHPEVVSELSLQSGIGTGFVDQKKNHFFLV